MFEHTPLPWKWHRKFEADDRNGSVYSEKREGHAYAVAMMPKYQTDEQWKSDAEFIVRAVNNHRPLVKALEEIGYIDDLLDADTAKRMLGIARDALTELRKNAGRQS